MHVHIHIHIQTSWQVSVEELVLQRAATDCSIYGMQILDIFGLLDLQELFDLPLFLLGLVGGLFWLLTARY